MVTINNLDQIKNITLKISVDNLFTQTTKTQLLLTKWWVIKIVWTDHQTPKFKQELKIEIKKIFWNMHIKTWEIKSKWIRWCLDKQTPQVEIILHINNFKPE